LARIPHAGTGVPLEYPFPAQYLGQKLSTVKRRFLPVDRPPASHLRQTSWTDHKTLIRETGFIGERLKAHESVLRDCSFIDVDDVWEVYRSHMDGDQRMPELYSLVTFLEMPVTKGLLHPDDADA
jgi:asparagine synthase (glutamine-hydrolysing)